METDKIIHVVNVIVDKCEICHGVSGMYVMNFDSSPLIREIECFRINIPLKRNTKLCYSEATRPLPIFIKPLNIRNLIKLINEGLL